MHELGDEERAINLMQQAIALYGWGCAWEWYRELGMWYREMGRVDEAIKSYESAVTCNPGDAIARQALEELSGSN